MKRYGNLYEQICSMDNIVAAHANAKRGKMHYQEVQDVEASIDTYVRQIQTLLTTKTFKTSEYVIITKTDSGKSRKIKSLP